MSTWKLVAFSIAWVFASMTIGVVTAVVVTELLGLVGLVDTGTDGYNISLNVITFAMFFLLISIPFVFRKRFVEGDSKDP